MNVEKKLDGFMKIALDEAIESRKLVLADLEEQYNKACEEYRKSAEKAAKKRIREKQESAQRMKSKEIILATAESKKSVIELRNQLLDSIFENVTAKLRDYVEMPEYGVNLLEDVKNACMDVESAIIYLMPSDMKYVRGKITIGGISYRESEEDFIGGYKLKFNENAMLDNTYKTRLMDARRNANIFRIEQGGLC